MPGNFYTVTYADIATWPVPHYDNPVHRSWLPAYAIFWECLTTLFIGGRLYLRFRNRSGSLGLDDAFIFVAWVFSVAFTALACTSVWANDIGRHIWDVRPNNYSSALYIAWLAQIMFIFSTGATKTSILLFYRRMAKNTYDLKWMIVVWVLLAITISSWISMFIAYCFMCQPLNAFWDVHKFMAQGDTDFKCLNGNAVTIAAGVITVASDFWCAALPCAMFAVHDLGVSKRQKIALNIIFCLGFLVTGVGIARTYYLWQMGQNQDLSWTGYDLFVTSIVECQLAIILTCAPFLRALFRRYAGTFTNISLSRGTRPASNNMAELGPIDWQKDPDAIHRPAQPTSRPTPNFSTNHRNMDFDTRQEKKGFLVQESGSGRLVWTERGSGSSSAT